jgi:hypothetical protein
VVPEDPFTTHAISDAAAAPQLVLEAAHAASSDALAAPARTPPITVGTDGTYSFELEATFRHRKGPDLINKLLNAPALLALRQYGLPAAGQPMPMPPAAPAAPPGRPATPPSAAASQQAQQTPAMQAAVLLATAAIDLLPLGLGASAFTREALPLLPKQQQLPTKEPLERPKTGSAAVGNYRVVGPAPGLSVSVSLLQYGPSAGKSAAPPAAAAPRPAGSASGAATAAAAAPAAAAAQQQQQQTLEPFSAVPPDAAAGCNVLEVEPVSLAPLPPALIAAQRAADGALSFDAMLLLPRGVGSLPLPLSALLERAPAAAPAQQAALAVAGGPGGYGATSGRSGLQREANSHSLSGGRDERAPGSGACVRRLHLMPVAVEVLKVGQRGGPAFGWAATTARRLSVSAS